VAALAGARDIHESASSELEATRAEAARQARIAELTATAQSFDGKVEPLGRRIVDLIGELRALVASIFDAHLETHGATAELATLLGEEIMPPDGIRFAIGVIERLRAKGVATNESALATLLPRPVDAWLPSLVAFVSESFTTKARQLATEPASPGHLEQTDALLDALRESTHYHQVKHKLLCASMGQPVPVKHTSVLSQHFAPPGFSPPRPR
jgi:hypothetical protein